MARASLARARGDTAAAISAYGALLDVPCPWWCQGELLAAARLLGGAGHLAEAARILNAPPTIERGLPPRPTDVLWYLERARVAERLGDRARAREAYGYVAAAWQHADPELEPYVAEARAARGRLQGEGGS